MYFQFLALVVLAIHHQRCHGDPNPLVNFPREIANAQKYPSPISNSSLIPLLVVSLATQKNTPLTKLTFSKEYNYIVVGTGPGGSVVANRLSEDGQYTVLVLEAGGDPPLLSDVPALDRYFQGTDLDWSYVTIPQVYSSYGLKNRQIPYPSGKALGGTTIFNAHFYTRGSQQNFDGWAAGGATGWSFSDVYPYFLKSEGNADPDIASNGYHSTKGPLTVSRPGDNPVIRKAFLDAAKSMGYPYVDINAKAEYGFADYQGTLRKGQRCSSVKAFLVPAETRANLDIVSNALVTKVVIENKKAVAVQFRYNGSIYEIKANREIIISAGTIKSPQILMLSGIGPKADLESMGIPVVADLPVGLNLQDQVGSFQDNVLSDTIRPFNERLADDNNIREYINSRTGPLASMEGFSNIAFLNGAQQNTQTPVDYELYVQEPAPLASEFLGSQYGLTEEVYRQYYAPYVNATTYSCYIEIQTPKSRGVIKLNSTEITDQPLIDPRYYSDDEDIKNMVAGLKTCLRFGESQPLQNIGSKRFATMVPGCGDLNKDEDKYLACMAKTIVNPAAQYVGTCKMGAVNDPTAVLDPELRVKGIQGLRVVDASIMPTIVTGNTQAAVYMIGEKASDMIKGVSPQPSPAQK